MLDTHISSHKTEDMIDSAFQFNPIEKDDETQVDVDPVEMNSRLMRNMNYTGKEMKKRMQSMELLSIKSNSLVALWLYIIVYYFFN